MGDRARGGLVAVGEEAAAAFDRDGVVVVDDLLSSDELDAYATAVSAAVTTLTAADRRALAAKSAYEQSFIQCINLWEDFPAVRPLTFHPRVAAAAAALLRTDAVRLWHDQALFKEPGGRITDLHQDQPYWPIAEPRTVTAWIPLDGATRRSGCLGYVRGSHRSGVRRFVDIFGGRPADLLADPALRDAAVDYIEVPRGSVAFHHGLTAHCALPNRAGAVRRVHTMIYFADGCTRGSDRPHFAVDRPAIAVGSPIAGDVTPIAFPADAIPSAPSDGAVPRRRPSPEG